MYDLTIIKHEGGNYIDSREVAELIGKAHSHLLRDIRGYITAMIENGLSKIGLSEFFLLSSYLNAQNKEMPCYLISKMGCELVANKLTGAKGVIFTVSYVKRFNELEAAERSELELLAAAPAPRLAEYNGCARIVARVMREMNAPPELLLKFLESLYQPFGIDIPAGGDIPHVPQMYTAKQIAEMLGIYSHNGNPHYHAVACIMNENIFIPDKHKSMAMEDYGYAFVCVRYDEVAVKMLIDWLDDYSYPSEIYGFERTYRVLYKV
jgi:Rha family phage regulatory protein